MFLYILLIAVVVFLLVFMGFGMKLVHELTRPKTHEYEPALDYMKEHGFDARGFLELAGPEEPLEYRSKYGYTLRGFILRNKNAAFADGRRRVVIFSHGYTANGVTMLNYGRFYYALGFDLVFYDHRYHGKSDKEGLFCSMGLYEAKDLEGLAGYVKQMFPENAVWGLHGESMGAATAVSAAAYIPWLSFCVEDCGFSNMKDQMVATMRLKVHKPPFPIVQFGDFILRVRYGFRMRDVRAVDHAAKVKIPMLFVHGGADDFVPVSMVHELYEAKPGTNKELCIYEGVLHAQSALTHPDEYGHMLEDFLRKYNII